MKIYWEWRYSSTVLTFRLEGWEWSASYPGARAPVNPLNRGLDGLWANLDAVQKRKIFCLCLAWLDIYEFNYITSLSLFFNTSERNTWRKNINSIIKRNCIDSCTFITKMVFLFYGSCLLPSLCKHHLLQLDALYDTSFYSWDLSSIFFNFFSRLSHLQKRN